MNSCTSHNINKFIEYNIYVKVIRLQETGHKDSKDGLSNGKNKGPFRRDTICISDIVYKHLSLDSFCIH